MKRLIYTGKVENGKIVLPSDKVRQEVVRAFEGHRIEVSFSIKRKTRSNDQNEYYWAVVVPMVLDGFVDLGNELQRNNPDHIAMVHGVLKDRFLANGLDLVDGDGVVTKTPASTRHCSTLQFEQYLDRVRDWSAECLGVRIPLPNEQAEFEF